MMCGAKRFIVRMEDNGDRKREYVTASTPAGARKIIRRHYGRGTSIISVREGSRTD